MAEIEIPKGGAYFYAAGDKYHILLDGCRVCIRCVEVKGGASGRLKLHMPSGNVVHIEGD